VNLEVFKKNNIGTKKCPIQQPDSLSMKSIKAKLTFVLYLKGKGAFKQTHWNMVQIILGPAQIGIERIETVYCYIDLTKWFEVLATKCVTKHYQSFKNKVKEMKEKEVPYTSQTHKKIDYLHTLPPIPALPFIGNEEILCKTQNLQNHSVHRYQYTDISTQISVHRYQSKQLRKKTNNKLSTHTYECQCGN
jgi:hypothetical protein